MKIEIVDNTVLLDGVKYIREETINALPSEVDFEIGKWYCAAEDHDLIYRVYDISDGIVHFESGDSRYAERDNLAKLNTIYGTRLATPAEIEAHLIKEAAKKGYKKGIKVSGDYRLGSRLWYKPEIDALYYSTNGFPFAVYRKGQWAKILPDKKPLPKTREEFEKYNIEWAEAWLKLPSGTTDKNLSKEFLGQYDFND